MSVVGNSAKRVNRADLLRALSQLGEDNLDITAEMSGFVAPPKRKVKLKLQFLNIKEGETDTSFQSRPVVKQQKGRQAHYYRVIEQKQSVLLPEPVLGVTKPKPQWYQAAERLNPDAIEFSYEKPPTEEPLVSWARLWPVLRSLLSDVMETRQPDIPRIVKAVANGVLLESIPRKTRQRWLATIQVLVDRPERARIFYRDYDKLLAELRRMRGETGLLMQTILRQPGRRVEVECGDGVSISDWQLPVAGTTVFILSDLGLLDKSGTSLRSWLKFGKQLCLAGCRPVVLFPLPERYLTPDLIGLFECVSWDRGSKLQPVTYVTPQEETGTMLQKDADGARQLLAWLSPAVRVEPALLRAVRHRLPIEQVDVGHELAAWHHDDVVPSRIGFHFQTQELESYRQQFKYQAEKNPELAKTITRLIRDYHCHVFPTQRDEELLILAQLMGNKLDECDQQELVQAKQAMSELVKASIEQGEEIPALHSFLGNLLERQHDDVLTENEFYQAIWAIKQSERGVSDEIKIPDGWNVENVLTFMDVQPTDERDYVLFQEKMQALQLSTRKRFQHGLDDFTEGSPLAKFKTQSGYFLKQHTDTVGRTKNTLMPLTDVDIVTLPLEKKERQSLHIAGQEIIVEQFTKPDWAVSIGRSHDALTVTTRSEESLHVWYWNPAISDQSHSGNESVHDTKKGFWCSEQIDELPCPAWAKTANRDQYGLCADVEIFGITQRFRWIEPASFMMGSPEDEEGRYGSETQHQVILTQGYWLADTACTQALWEVVMKNNPSEFKGEMKPVENVSWDDIEGFLKELNKHDAELKLRLPSEAEWENACRAGTTSPFNFDDKLSLDKVNFSGTWEYELGKWGEGALQQTAEVKSYPSNAWGLYEMHGNVWEWCQDWYAVYPTEPIVDPQGPDHGGLRVLRGGSWIDGGGSCRSACRNHLDPADRYDFIGFRLARGH